MEFFGVTTAQSSAMQLFPNWAQAMGVENVVLRGVDLPLPDPWNGIARRWNPCVPIRLLWGALVTSHKLAVVRAAEDLIDHLTPEAHLCGEVSALYKRQGALCGHACDPANCGLALRRILPDNWWERYPRAGILSLGGGGATVALMVYLLTQARQRPVILAHYRKAPRQSCALPQN